MYEEYVQHIKKQTEKRFVELCKKAPEALCPKEAFEKMLLCMVDPDPSKRGTAEELKYKTEQILLGVHAKDR